MKGTQTKNVARATLFVALAVALSPLSIPIGVTRIFPAQAMVNVLSAVLLGPWYALLVAFTTSLVRNLLGTGTINAFAGSMIGAVLAGFAWRATRNIYLSALGEVVGTGVLATLVTVYLVAPNILHQQLAVAVIGLSFLASTLGGSLLGIVVLKGLRAAGYVRDREIAQIAIAPHE